MRLVAHATLTEGVMGVANALVIADATEVEVAKAEGMEVGRVVAKAVVRAVTMMMGMVVTMAEAKEELRVAVATVKVVMAADRVVKAKARRTPEK